MESDRGAGSVKRSSIRRADNRSSKSNSIYRIISICLKVLEIVAGIVCVGLLRYYYLLFSYDSRLYLAIITTGGFTMVSGVFLLGILMGQNKIPMQEVLINVLGIAMYIATGAMSIDVYLRFNINSETTRVGVVFGALAIGTGLIYAVDTIVSLKSLQSSDDDDD